MSLLGSLWSLVAPEPPVAQAGDGATSEASDAARTQGREPLDDPPEHEDDTHVAGENPSADQAPRPRLESLDVFNEAFAALHLALAENRAADAVRLLRSVGALAKNDEARQDMVAALRAKALTAACATLSTFSTGAISFPDALHLWQLSIVEFAGSRGDGSAPNAGNIKLIQDAFIGALETIFAESAADVLRRMDTVRSLLAVGGPSVNAGSDAGGADRAPLHEEAQKSAHSEPSSSGMGVSGLSVAARFFFSSSSGGGDGSGPNTPTKGKPKAKASVGPHPYLVRHKRPIHLALKGQDSSFVAARRDRLRRRQRGGRGGFIGDYDDRHGDDGPVVDEDEVWKALEAVAAMGADDEEATAAPPGAGGGGMMEEESAGSTQPHIEALSTLLGDATQLMMAIDQQISPPIASGMDDSFASLASLLSLCKRQALQTLHRVCTAAAVQALKAYRGDTMLDSTLLVATQTLHQVLDADSAVGSGGGGGGGGGSTSNTRLMRCVCEAAGIPFDAVVALTATGPLSAGMLAGPTATTLDQELVVLELSTGLPYKPSADAFLASLEEQRRAASGQQQKDGPRTNGVEHHGTDHCALPLGMAVSIVDETADQISFLCQLLERYSRCVGFCLDKCGGSATDSLVASNPSEMSAQPAKKKNKKEEDALLLTLWELQGHYVQLERSYILSSVRLALLPPNGWKVVSVHDDGRVKTYAWCDNVFFLLSKGVSRAAATCADMAAAAVTNYVAGCCDDILKRVLYACSAVGSGLVRNARDPRLNPGHLKRMLMDAVAADNHQSASDSFIASLLGSVSIDDDEEEAGEDEELRSGGLGRQLSRLLRSKGYAGYMAAPGPSSGATGGSNGGARGGAGAHSSSDGGGDHEEDAFEAEIAASFKAAFTQDGGSGDGTEGEGQPKPKQAPQASSSSTDEQSHQAFATHFPVASETAILSVNTVATAGQYAAALFERTSAELVAVFPSSAGDSACSPLLVAPLQQLKEASEACGPPLLQLATKTFTYTVCRAGMQFFGGVLRRVDYVLPSAEAFDALSGAHDPIMTAVSGPLLSGSGFHSTLPLLLKPSVSDAFVLELSAMLAARIDKRWSRVPVNEYGALLMASQLRSLYNALSPYIKAAHAPLRSLLASGRLHQMVQVLNVESLSDLTGLMFPVPALTKHEMSALLNHRTGFLAPPSSSQSAAPSGASTAAGDGHAADDSSGLSEAARKVLATVPWHRVPIMGDSD